MATTIRLKNEMPTRPALLVDSKTNIATIVTAYCDVRDPAMPGALPSFNPYIEFIRNVDVKKGLSGDMPIRVDVNIPSATAPQVFADPELKLFYVLTNGQHLKVLDAEKGDFLDAVTDQHLANFSRMAYKLAAPGEVHLEVLGQLVDADIQHEGKTFPGKKLIKSGLELRTPEDAFALKDHSGLLKFAEKVKNPEAGFKFKFLGHVKNDKVNTPIFFLMETGSIYFVRKDTLCRIETKFNNAFRVDGGILLNKVKSTDTRAARAYGITYDELADAIHHGPKKMLSRLKKAQKTGMEISSIETINGVDMFLSLKQLDGVVDIMYYDIPQQSYIKCGELHGGALDENFLFTLDDNDHLSRVVFLTE